MYPPIFAICAAAPAVTALLGAGPVRLYPFASAPQPGTDFYALPYAVWQIVGGLPENYLGRVPDIDSMTLQIDAYAAQVAQARSVAMALRDAIEPHAHIVSWRGESFEADTGLYRYSFDVDWWVPR